MLLMLGIALLNLPPGNWFTLKIFVYFLGIQLMIQVVMLMLEVLFGIINAERAAREEPQPARRQPGWQRGGGALAARGRWR